MKKGKLKAKKPKHSMGGVQADYLQSQQQGNMVTNVVGKINPIVGLGLKAGQMIGAQTMDQNGIYKSKTGQFLDNSINPTTGIQNLKDVMKDPSANNIANQLTLGLVGKGATQKKREKAIADQKVLDDIAWRNDQGAVQTMPTFKHGGKLTAENVVGGGQVESISPDAVQVKANDPGKTDSVELDNAFVDHNEVIDNQNRVFSDSLKAPNGKTIAKEAARLEKMKSNNSRFAMSNQHIDQRLDKLFQYQEGIKKPRKAVGGLLEDPTTPPPPKKTIKGYVGPTYEKQNPNLSPNQNHDIAVSNLVKAQMLKNSVLPQNPNLIRRPPSEDIGKYKESGAYLTLTPQVKHKMDSVLSTRDQLFANNPKWSKAGFWGGGKIGEEELVPGSTQVDLRPEWQKSQLSGGLLASSEGKQNVNPFQNFKKADTGPQFSFQEPKKPNYGNIAAGAGQFASDAMNLYLASKQAKPKAPNLEKRVELGRVHADAALAENARATANANRAMKGQTSQASQAGANAGANLAKRMYADNQVNQSVNNQNTELIGREALLNSGINARNVERQNRFKDDTVAAKNAKLSNYSQIASNVGTKAMQMRQEKQKQEYDAMYIDVLRQKYKDSGLNDRFVDMIMKKKEDEAYRTGKFKYGGKLPKMKNGKKC